jgi:aspartyl/glutamyl-tRNA(Asn/Gln) amidotransferase C subunit
MPKLDNAAIKKIARLAQIKITDEEIDTSQQELSNIINLAQEIQNINTDDVEFTSTSTQPLIKKYLYIVPPIIE